MIRYLRQHLGFKLFLSYLFVILAVLVVVAFVVELSLPLAFNTHMMPMMGIVDGPMMGMGGMMAEHNNNWIELFGGFRNSVNQALVWSGLAALVVAAIVSVFISRRLISPIRELTEASQRIAAGQYAHRVWVPADYRAADELSRLAFNFNQMAEQLAQTENMRRQLIGDVSHELRTPLAAIQGSMEGLIDAVLPPSPETFKQIHQEVDRLQILVNDLQELSRVEANAVPLERVPSDLARCIEDVDRRLRRQFEEKDVRLDLDLPGDLPPVSLDPNRISQVLTNLIGNALQYSPAGGSVVVSASRENGAVQVCVRDSGIGISAEHLPHLFTRFYRVDKSRSRVGGGSGIGLTIAKHIVEAHGGRIWAESDGPGTGSRFYFTLPVDKK